MFSSQPSPRGSLQVGCTPRPKVTAWVRPLVSPLDSFSLWVSCNLFIPWPLCAYLLLAHFVFLSFVTLPTALRSPFIKRFSKCPIWVCHLFSCWDPDRHSRPVGNPYWGHSERGAFLWAQHRAAETACRLRADEEGWLLQPVACPALCWCPREFWPQAWAGRWNFKATIRKMF